MKIPVALLGIVLALLITSEIKAQCIVINEIMVNAAGNCDGGCTPNTAEWVELYNTCSEPVDLSCFVLTDEDFSITFPEGTIIAANGFFVLGSVNSGVSLNLDWGTCGCTSGLVNQVGIFTNGNEQLALIRPDGGFEDAVYWGSGQFDQNANFAVDAIGNCPASIVNLVANDPNFEALPAQNGNDGNTVFRNCDGGAVWSSGTQAPTPGATNGQGAAPSAEITASTTSICPGNCIDFNALTGADISSVNWTFSGSSTTTATGTSVTQVCYPDAGVFDVTVELTNACGTVTLNLPQYINVNTTTEATVFASGPLSFCSGDSVILSTPQAGTYQWYSGTAPLEGATNDSLVIYTSGTYYLMLQSGACVGQSPTVNVVVSDGLQPTISFPGLARICPGDSLLLNTESGFENYTWYIDGIAQDIHDAQFMMYHGGQVYVEVSSGTCTGTSGLLVVTEIANQPIAIGNQLILNFCPGSQPVLTATSGFDQYDWYLNGQLSQSGPSSNFSVSSPSTVSVVGTYGPSCPSFSDTVVVQYYTPSEVFINPLNNPYVCEGDSLLMTVNDAYTSYQWYFQNDAIAGATNPQFYAHDGGDYAVSVTDQNGCNAVSAPVSITYVPLPSVSIDQVSPYEVCGDSTTLHAVTTNGLPVSYIWLDQNGNFIGQSGALVYIYEEGTYTATAIVMGACTGTSSPVQVVFHPVPQLSVTANPLSACVGESVELTASSDANTFAWSNGGSASQVEITQSGSYSVTVSNQFNCSASSSISFQFDPLPLVDAGLDTIADCALGVVLDGFAQGNYAWSPTDGLSDVQSLSPIAIPDATTTYTLTANLNGCIATDEVIVVSGCTSIIIPNVFTPNGDDDNETFKVSSRGIVTFELMIYNRWGEKVFETTNPDEGWKGEENGKEAADGTYFYTIVAKDRNGKSLITEDKAHGSLTLLR